MSKLPMIQTIIQIATLKFFTTVATLATLASMATWQSATAGNVKTGSDYITLSFKKCKTIEISEVESPYYHQVCPALGGYKIDTEGMDGRNRVTLSYGKKSVEYGSDNFSDIGEKAEWRYRQTGNKKMYHALIYRMYEARQNPKTGGFYPPSQDKQTLVVMRLNKEKSCLLGVINAHAKMNEKARELADNPNAPRQK